MKKILYLFLILSYSCFSQIELTQNNVRQLTQLSHNVADSVRVDLEDKISTKQDVITGSESIFSTWDKSGNDDFSGDYNDLTNKPITKYSISYSIQVGGNVIEHGLNLTEPRSFVLMIINSSGDMVMVNNMSNFTANSFQFTSAIAIPNCFVVVIGG